MAALYDKLGVGYRQRRIPDVRIAERLHRALGDARSVLNVGAGTGSYEPEDRNVVAVELSRLMLAERSRDAACAVQASADHLPFAEGSFDAALAILTLHHWPDRAQGLAEMLRVARRRVVLLTWDPESVDFWLLDYFPEILEVDRQIFPSLSSLREQLSRGACTVEIESVPIPADCTDGFLGAYWRRPEAYLETEVRSAISTFARVTRLEQGLAQLRADLASGEWQERHGDLLERESLDLGYRLVVSEHGSA